MASPALSPLEVIVAALIVLGVVKSFLHRKRSQYHPGPPGLPLVGNTFQVPPKSWNYFKSLGLKYGPVVHISVGGDNVLLLSRALEANELLDKRSAIYSSRPRSIYAGKYQSQGKRTVIMPYGPTLRRHRAIFQQLLQTKSIGAYEIYQDAGSVKLLHDILTQPDDTFMNVHRFSASLIFQLTYGRRLEGDDKDLKAVLRVLENFVREITPGSHLVDALPILDILPDLLAPWRVKALKAHEEEMKLYFRLAKEVKTKMDTGGSNAECFLAHIWEEQEKLDIDEKEIAYVGGTAFEAGTGTTADSILWFLAAALLFPDPIHRAQQEIDAIVGDRMPTFADFKDMPYCAALVKEIFRWCPSIPGMPHASDRDDNFQGYRVDKGTVIMPNIWGMHHDEEKFDPSRYLCSENSDPEALSFEGLVDGHYLFGFGRRICPGRYLASKSVWLAVTRILWAFSILPVVDIDGKPILPDMSKCSGGVTNTPDEFPVRLVCRSEERANTVRQATENIIY
ncbi:hypothetical protein JAAARDRAFT_135284 [Jaapia argillacea MUCL 33604]|uniref:Cytochrome P450 n=1 Tax=Jaapia argillacea MUCL 33604 TaxID=933084 RepID=A0A067PW92_9AGAM|nr:hypothetical protein JAAARDRAFT_135284 [Jaapia argillacea MUCL 33604]